MKFLLSLSLALFLLSSGIKAQETQPSMILKQPTIEDQKKLRLQLDEFEHDTRKTFLNLMAAESAWSLANIAISAAARNPNQFNNYHDSNIFLNSYNLIFTGSEALFNLGAPLRVKSYLDRSERYKKVFAAKTAVEGVFLVLGLVSLKNSTPTSQYVNGTLVSQEQNGGTYSLLVNSAVLMGFDIAGLVLEGKHIEKIRPIIRSNQIGFILDLN